MAAKKPTKQQIAQAKARAGGNTTSKTTPARMAKGAKDIALFAASASPAGISRTAATKLAQAAVTKAGTGVVRATMGKATSKVYKAAKTKEFQKRNETTALLKNTKKYAEPKSGVKTKSSRVATGPGLETRGVKPTSKERISRSRELQADKAEREYDKYGEMRYTGLVSSDKGMLAARGAGKKNQRKRDAIRREANKNVVRINSASKKSK